jgi:hypothetical protein
MIRLQGSRQHVAAATAANDRHASFISGGNLRFVRFLPAYPASERHLRRSRDFILTLLNLSFYDPLARSFPNVLSGFPERVRDTG